MSSCMYFPKGMSIIEKRLACKPQVYRYRYPSAEIALGHTNKGAIYGCHELEVYANDRLTCGSGAALILFDMSGRLRQPRHDDPARRQAARHAAAVQLRGSPRTRPSRRARSSPTASTAPVRAPRPEHPELAGLGRAVARPACATSAACTTRAATPPARSVPVHRGHRLRPRGRADRLGPLPARHRRARRRRPPPGATCTPGADNTEGNGGVHAYASRSSRRTMPQRCPTAWEPYARNARRRRRRSTARRCGRSRRPRSAPRT